MIASVFSNLGLLNIVIVALTGLSRSNPIKPAETHHRASAGVDVIHSPLHSAHDFLSLFLSTLNLTRLRDAQPGMPAVQREPLPEYMLELYNRFANDRTAVPSANIARSFKNEDSSPQSISATDVWIHPLLFNISVPHQERIKMAELRLFMLVRKAQRPHAGFSCKATVYKIHDGVVWTEEVGKEGRGRDKEEVVKDLEELVTKHIHAKDNGWVSFDLTNVVTDWQKSGGTTHRLEVHIESLGADEDGATREALESGRSLAEVDIERSVEGQHNSVVIVFSDDQTGDHREELSQVIKHENGLSDNMATSQQPLAGHADLNSDNYGQNEPAQRSASELRSNLVYNPPPRIRRSANSVSCRRTPLFVDFKDIGWNWIIQPLGYEAYKCNGVCSTPMTSEVSPTKHAIVQTQLSHKRPERVSAACCVPTKLEPISLLYRDDGGVPTFNHKYEGMVVAECGCR
uniref:Bone morphotic protein 10 n=1 Tax=Fundulus heteroclitus TaxID=8078 RepID=A0A3Q2QY44_FUNHE